MSLADKKGALFGKASSTTSSNANASAPVSKTTTGSSLTSASQSTTMKTSVTASGSVLLSADMRAKKMVEAKEFLDKAAKSLQTSIFQWSPDHVAAAGFYDAAANTYASLGDNENARQTLMKAVASHEAAGTLSAAASDLLKAAKLSSVSLFKQNIIYICRLII